MKYLLVLFLSIFTISIFMFGHFEYERKTIINSDSLESTGWENKNWLAIGDSITHANKYQPLVQKSLKMKAVKTDAIPGRPIKPMADDITAGSMKNIDLITVFGGTNDFGSSKPLGTFNDDKDEDTFYGNLKNLIEKINKVKSPQAKVVFFTPLKRGAFKNQPVYPNANLNGYKLDDYVNAEKQVCKLYAIPVIDLFNKSGLEVNNLSTYTIDNLHPNDEGYKMISKIMIKELRKTAAN